MRILNFTDEALFQQHLIVHQQWVCLIKRVTLMGLTHVVHKHIIMMALAHFQLLVIFVHQMRGSLPAAGDICTSDAAGTTPLSAGYYNINAATGVGNRLVIKISTSTGAVDSGWPQYC